MHSFELQIPDSWEWEWGREKIANLWIDNFCQRSSLLSDYAFLTRGRRLSLASRSFRNWSSIVIGNFAPMPISWIYLRGRVCRGETPSEADSSKSIDFDGNFVAFDITFDNGPDVSGDVSLGAGRKWRWKNYRVDLWRNTWRRRDRGCLPNGSCRKMCSQLCGYHQDAKRSIV